MSRSRPFPDDIPFPAGNDEVVSKGPCPKCSTSRGFVTYADSHSTCFACGHKVPRSASLRGGEEAASRRRPPSDSTGHPRIAASSELLEASAQTNPYRDLSDRKLLQPTLKRFGYFTAGYEGKAVQVAPYHNQDGELVAQKLRTPDKRFIVVGAESKLNDCRMFGHHVFGDRFDRKVVVCEGEIDAMSVAQVSDFKYAVVSLNTGAAGAAKCIKKNYLWLDRFGEIVLWFDDDEPGKAATEECAKLFAVGKVRIAKAPTGFKDASDLLKAGKPGDIESAVYMATGWRPAGIVNAASHVEDVLALRPEDCAQWSYHWPWAEVEDFLGPILPGQVCYHVAGTGIGKTTAISEIAYNLVKQGCKIALIGFEDTRRDLKFRLLNIHVSDRLDINPRSDEEMAAIHRDFFDAGMVELFDPDSAEWTIEAVLSYIRYCAKALDCRYVSLDPLTVLAALLAAQDDERRALDKVSCDLALLAKELLIHIHVAHHLTEPEGNVGHEDGAATSVKQVRGSRGIANLATFVIGHERNQQADGEGALVTQLRALKNRPRSKTGPMVALLYAPTTGRLEVTDLKFPGAGKHQKGGRSRDFPPATSTDY